MTGPADRAGEFDRYRRVEGRFQVAAVVGPLLLVGVVVLVRANVTGFILVAIASLMCVLLFGTWQLHMRSYICGGVAGPSIIPGSTTRACARARMAGVLDGLTPVALAAATHPPLR